MSPFFKESMMSKIKLKCSVVAWSLALAICPLAVAPAAASVITDPVGDFIPTFTGPANADLDVTGFRVDFSGTNFMVHTELAGNVGLTPGGIYVYGVNRGAGFANFAPIGHGGVKFDAVVIVDPGGTIGNIIFDIAANAVVGTISPHIHDNIIDFVMAASVMPSLGFAPDRWGWNLWPRSSPDPTDDAVISDFAPDNSTLAAVPETGAWAMMLAGFGLLGAALRRTRKRLATILA
jgi:hypothetical protein